jgi:hypothetical protein
VIYRAGVGDTGMNGPVEEVGAGPQIVDETRRSAPGGCVGEIERQRAAQQVEVTGGGHDNLLNSFYRLRQPSKLSIVVMCKIARFPERKAHMASAAVGEAPSL